jgi:serine/threonine-protein kinase
LSRARLCGDSHGGRNTGEAHGATAGRGPFFSPDGRWIGFWQDGRLKKVSVTGGAPLVSCPAENPFGVSWTSDNTILYGQSEAFGGKVASGIWRVSSEGGKPEHVVKVEAGQIAVSPRLLPGAARHHVHAAGPGRRL